MSSIRILISTSTEPCFNLAVEDLIFRSMSVDKRILFLWRNADSVIIGRAQNPWKECNTLKMQRDGITLARRQTGGGAVFHDLGNTNFTFMASKPEYNKSISTKIVLDALLSLGIKAKSSGRNDFVIEDHEGEKKFSGSAYREAKDRGFHHGTLLLNANLSRLADYLNPDPKKLKAKGISSVRARVTNLSEITPSIDHEKVCDAIIDAFCDYYGERTEVQYVSAQTFLTEEGFKEKFEHQSSWQWNFGQAPEFMYTLDERFTWGGVELHLNVQKGCIVEAKMFTDSLDPAPLEMLSRLILDKTFNTQTFTQAIDKVTAQFPERRVDLTELQKWLIEVIT
ncbi:lipoate-protein ligase A [Psychromonas sp. CNPT3]|uniref:lipoate--protein ligase n=1 Tax=Psychromonas sp. CNPT3 TaxID=314282 RepID=UPI00006E486C|nr:lipoate--protein ligase [Psychromonas sp. CNPT3]AGH80678.1 lipoate-protein ligase A [Psychromonas sp. CNPT3]